MQVLASGQHQGLQVLWLLPSRLYNMSLFCTDSAEMPAMPVQLCGMPCCKT